MNTSALRTIRLVLFAIVVATPPVFAEQQPSPEMRRQLDEYQKKNNRENLTGWNGVIFYCPIDEQSSRALNEICENSYTNAEFLAASAKVNLKKARSGYEVGFSSRVSDFLILEVELGATKPGIPSAVHASLRAYVGYSEVVTKSGYEGQKRARETPRSGDLIFWERATMGASSGSDQALVAPMSEAIEQLLKQFFADYLNAQH